MTWIKVHQSLRDHRKTMTLCDVLDIDEATAIGHCVAFWMWAIDNTDDGSLPDSDRVLARAALWKGDPHQFVSGMITAEFITTDRFVRNWDEYMGRLIEQRSEKASRMRTWRKQKKNVHTTKEERDDHVATHRDDHVLPRIEKNREEKKREEKNSPPGSTSVEVDARSAPKPKRKTRLEPDWFPSNGNLLYASNQGMSNDEIQHQAELFRDHWLANGEVKDDWDATWRNWIRRAPQFTRNGTGGQRRNKDGSIRFDFAEHARKLEAEGL